MVLLDGGHHTELASQVVEALLVSGLGKAVVHIGPLVVLTLSGVKELLHLDENQVVLHTPLGLLQVYGQELKLKNLSPDGGQVQLTGQIDALAYEEPGRLSSKRRRK